MYQIGWFSTGRDEAGRDLIAKIGAREGLPAFDELANRYRELYKQEL